MGPISKLAARGRGIRWGALYASARFIYEHGRRIWGNLEAADRERMGALVRKSKGRRANLTQRERDELWALVKKAGR